MKLLLGFAGCVLLLTNLACDKGPGDPGGENPPVDETFTTFLENFARAYSERDSTGYDRYLDPSYIFELLPDEVGPGAPHPWWDRVEELSIAGKMFHERFGDGNVKVMSIDLALTLKTAEEDTTHGTGRPEGETWYKVKAAVDLRVIAGDPGASDGTGITHFIVYSDQNFVIRRDPQGSGRYIIVRQEDQEPINKVGAALPSGTEETSWGSVKSLFR